MDPKILSKLADLLKTLGIERTSFLSQYDYWIKKNGPDCRYAAIAKTLFENDIANNVAQEIIYLYENWAKFYK